MLQVQELSKRYPGNPPDAPAALDEVSLAIQPGEFFTLLGPSGCGKTTMLRSIAGLERPDAGRISIGGRALFDSEHAIMVPANRRRIGMVFQSYAIWPHLDVFENVAFPLRVGGERHGEADVKAKVRRALETVEMGAYERRPAGRLSGGQQQRLAIARAIAMEPEILLLDEPLSNLDALLRETMRRELRHLQKSLGITTIYVTHDQTEALALSDTVAVMNAGRITQLGTPQSIYNTPANRFVAEFIGSTNLICGHVSRHLPNQEIEVEHNGLRLRCPAPVKYDVGQPLMVSIRPEAVRLHGPGESALGDANVMQGRIMEQIFLGAVSDNLIQVGETRWRVWGRPDPRRRPGDDVALAVDVRDCVPVADGAVPAIAAATGI